jgi:predicted TIM-barrel fold metal-dependent hydrolase
MINGNIDVHCHFFNIDYAFRELLEIGWRWINGNYPYKSDERAIMPKAKMILPAEVQSIVEYVASFFKTAIGSPEENYGFEQQSYTDSDWNHELPLVTVPLMMDIYFILDKGASQQRQAQLRTLTAKKQMSMKTPPITEKDIPAYDAFAEEMKTKVLEVLNASITSKTPKSRAMLTTTTDAGAKLDRVIKEFKTANTPGVLSRAFPSGNTVQMSPGYQKHLEALKSLRKKYRDSVFPFLAIDPRRIGIEKLVLDQVVKGSFFGVKLYCPLGYLPSHPDLFPVYQLCLKYDIPITAHTSPGGLPSACPIINTSKKTKEGQVVPVVFDKKSFLKTHTIGKDESAHSLFFADPGNWIDVLESKDFQKLRVNFAHFGGQKQVLAFANGTADNDNWTGKIIGFMEKFDNVYADVAFCPDDGMLQAITEIIKQHPKVGERLMFGTDFVMLMMNRCGLKFYFDHYTGIPTQLVTTNPKSFLKL